MKTKSVENVRFKLLEKEGEFEAEFATLNVIDKQDDVTLPGAIEEGAPVKISAYNHTSWDGALPVGRGTIHEIDNKLVVRGRFFLDTFWGNETYKTVKNLADMQEWSYGYDVIDSMPGEFEGKPVRFLKKLKIYEVSPVILGAGVDTRVVDIKVDRINAQSITADKLPDIPGIFVKQAIPSHQTDTVDKEWDAAENVKRLKADQDYAYYKQMFAWVDPEGDRSKKSSYKFPHHEVDEGGNIGAANVRACIAVIAALNGARGGTNIPDSDRKGVWNHVARHLRDADMEPAPLKAEVPGEMKYRDHLMFVLEAVKGIKERTEDIAEKREKIGKVISQASLDLLEDINEELKSVSGGLDSIIRDHDLVLKEVTRFMATEEKLKKMGVI